MIMIIVQWCVCEQMMYLLIWNLAVLKENYEVMENEIGGYIILTSEVLNGYKAPNTLKHM